MTATARRAGTTLMEVLIATGILAVGMIAILALFPIGAVNMARAINQDRAATHGVNSDELMRMYWKEAWLQREPLTRVATHTICATNEDAYANSQEPMLLLLSAHPTYGPIPDGTFGLTPVDPLLPANSQPGFPVLVDPIGWRTKAGDLPSQGFVAGNPNFPVRTTLRRCIAPATNPFPRPVPYGSMWAAIPYPQTVTYTPAPVITPPYTQLDPRPVVRLTTLLDDMTYDASGEPAVPAAQLERGGRYSVAWLLQRPRVDQPAEVNIHVLVYAGRSPTDTPSPETEFPQAEAVPGQKTILFPLINGQAAPPLRKGAWLAFTMLIPPTPNTQERRYPTLDFYRVVAVNDDVPNVLAVELESPIKQQTPLALQPLVLQPGVTGYIGSVIVFDNLFDVFDRGLITPISVTHK